MSGGGGSMGWERTWPMVRGTNLALEMVEAARVDSALGGHEHCREQRTVQPQACPRQVAAFGWWWQVGSKHGEE